MRQQFVSVTVALPTIVDAQVHKECAVVEFDICCIRGHFSLNSRVPVGVLPPKQSCPIWQRSMINHIMLWDR
jgi:hypothetical protein